MKRYRWILGGFIYLFLSCLSVCEIQAEPTKVQTVEQAYPGFAADTLKNAKMIEMQKGKLLISDCFEIRESQIKEIVEKADPKIRLELRKNLFFLLEQETMKSLILKEARSSGVNTKGFSEMEVINTYLNQKFSKVQVSDPEIKAFYDANKDMVGDTPYEQVKEAIKQVLVQQKKQDNFASYLKGLGEKADIQVNSEWVKAQYALAKDNPVDKARMSGKPTMVEFGATGCVPCDMMQPILETLRRKFTDNLNIVFVHVGEHQILKSRFNIQAIPVQVFFDRVGQEVFRHVGFFAELEILKQLATMGVE